MKVTDMELENHLQCLQDSITSVNRQVARQRRLGAARATVKNWGTKQCCVFVPHLWHSSGTLVANEVNKNVWNKFVVARRQFGRRQLPLHSFLVTCLCRKTNMAIHTEINVEGVLVVAVFLYGAECWVLRELDEHKVQGGAKNGATGYPIWLLIFRKLHDRIAWKLVDFCNIICWTQSLTFRLKMRHLAKTPLLSCIHTVQIDLNITQ